MHCKRHIAYTPNLIPTPHMRQGINKERKIQKERNVNPQPKQKHAPHPHHQRRTLILTQKIDSQEKEIINPRKIIPTKLQTHLNKLEPHGYIKSVARAQSTRLYPIRRKNLQ